MTAMSGSGDNSIVTGWPLEHITKLSSLTPCTDEYEQEVKNIIETVQSRLVVSLQTGGEVSLETAQLIAEMAKSEAARVQLLNEGVVPVLVPFLTSDNRELSFQVVRALGNMCYEQDGCRLRILECNGMKLLHIMLGTVLEDRGKSIPLKTASCGFLHNLINGNEECQTAAIDVGMLSLIKKALEMHSTVSGICNFSYMIISSLLEVEGGKEAVIKSGCVKTLLKLFVNTNIEDMDEILLGLLSSLASDSDEVKRDIAESTADMHLLGIVSLLSSSTQSEDEELVRTASELLVLVLTGDEAMKIWFDGGNGLLFKSVCDWLHSSNAQLLQSAAFAIGNFARDDEHSSLIITMGISDELHHCLDQLHPFSKDQATAPTIHAILSALRNLAIAHRNKSHLLEHGIMEHLLPYMETENTIIASKLMGLIRLLLDKQEKQATLLGSDENFVRRVAHFADIDTNTLLKGESIRCLASLVKNSRNPSVMKNVMECGIKHLLFLVNSEHAVMQNEGLISLILMATSLPDKLSRTIKDTDVLTKLSAMMAKEELPIQEVLQNTLMLLNQLVANGMAAELKAANFTEILEPFLARITDETLINITKSLLISISS